MATAKKIYVEGCGPNKDFPNNFMKYKNVDPIQLVNGDNWFYIDVTIFSFDLAYLYLVSTVDQDVEFTIHRSACVDTEDTDYAVPIPGATATLPTNTPNVACADFSMSLFGAERIWIKATANNIGKGNNKIDELYLTIKK